MEQDYSRTTKCYWDSGLFSSFSYHEITKCFGISICFLLQVKCCRVTFLDMHTHNLSTALQSLVGPWLLFQYIDLFTHSIGFHGWGMSSSQGCYLHRGHHKHRINAHRHPCLKCDSNPRSQFWVGEDCSCLRPPTTVIGRPKHVVLYNKKTKTCEY
jgi:hypothetical protein